MIATAERYVNVVNLTDPTRFFKTQLSPLGHQTRVISCFIDSSGWAVGSNEGRCGFQYIDPKDAEYVDSFHSYQPFFFISSCLHANYVHKDSTSPSSAIEANL
jgi:mRNA export factor